jgi:hypothetical protein
MTDFRDPIAAALEDLRTKEAGERLHYSYPYLWQPSDAAIETLPGTITDLAASQEIALGGRTDGPDQIDAWQAQLDAIPPGRSDLALVGLQHNEMLDRAIDLLREDGLEPANLRELLSCPVRLQLREREQDDGIRIWAFSARNPDGSRYSFLQPRAPGFPALRASTIGSSVAGPGDLFLVRLDAAARRRFEAYTREWQEKDDLVTP